MARAADFKVDFLFVRFTCACSSRLIDGYDWWALSQLAACSPVRLFACSCGSLALPLTLSLSHSPVCRQKPNSTATALLIYIRTKMCCRPNRYNWTFYSLFIGHTLSFSLSLSLTCSSALGTVPGLHEMLFLQFQPFKHLHNSAKVQSAAQKYIYTDIYASHIQINGVHSGAKNGESFLFWN